MNTMLVAYLVFCPTGSTNCSWVIKHGDLTSSGLSNTNLCGKVLTEGQVPPYGEGTLIIKCAPKGAPDSQVK